MLARRLCATAGLDHAVAMSGFSADQTKRRAKEVGIQHYLVKPVDSHALARTRRLS